MAIVILSVSNFSAAASWNDISSIGNNYYDSLHYWGNDTVISTSALDEFNTYKIPIPIDSIQLDWIPDDIHRQDFVHNIFINKTLNTMPDELLTLQINSQPLIWAQPSEWDNDIQPASEAADYIVFNSNADYIKSVRIPAPTSLLLVAIGLISLRYTRSLKL